MDNIDKLFRDKLENAQVQAPENLWERIEDKIGQKASLSSNAIKLTAISAAVATIAIGTYFFSEKEHKRNIPNDETYVVSAKIQEQEDMIAEEEVIQKTNTANIVITNKNTEKTPIKETASMTKDTFTVTTHAINNNTSIIKEETKTIESTSPAREQETIIIKENKQEQSIAKPQIKENSERTNIAKSIFESIVISNVITPNNDGYNDYFIIKNLETYPDNTLTVFSAKGQVLYKKHNYDNSWSAERVPTGNYFYKLEIKHNNKIEVKTGSIAVVR